MRRVERGEELAAEEGAEDIDGEEMRPRAGIQRVAVGRQAASGDDGVHMGMEAEIAGSRCAAPS